MERLVSTLVLLHAFPLDHSMFDEVADLVAETGWEIVLPDLRGCGGASDFDEEPTLEACARDVVKILDRLGVQKAVVGGCSLGGYVTMALMRFFPERVAAAIFIDTKASADTEEARANRLKMADQMAKSETTEVLWRAMLPNALGETTRREKPEVVERTREIMAASRPAGVAALQRAMANRSDSHEVIRQCGVPVLSIRGSEDVIASAADHAAICDAAQESVHIELPEVGHLAPLEAPAETAAAIIEFLEKVRRPSC